MNKKQKTNEAKKRPPREHGRLRRFASGWVGSALISVALAAGILAALGRFPGSAVTRNIQEALPPAFDELPPVLSEVLPRPIANARRSSYLDLIQNIQFVEPKVFGVDGWDTGDFARYSYTTDRPDKPGKTKTYDVSVDVLGPIDAHHAVTNLHGPELLGMHWLRFTGLSRFRNLGIDIYQAASIESLERIPPKPSFTFRDDYIPLPLTMPNQKEVPRKLKSRGTEVVSTPMGDLECNRYELSTDKISLDLWTHPDAGPLGIVKAATQNESIVLAETGRQESVEVPETLEPLVDGRSTFAFFCASCHPNEDHHNNLFPPR